MAKYIKKEKFTEFHANKKINIQKLSEEIRVRLGESKWEDNPKKEGFSGISTVTDKLGNVTIIVHWTNDGVHGFNLDLPEVKKLEVVDVINKHKDK